MTDLLTCSVTDPVTDPVTNSLIDRVTNLVINSLIDRVIALGACPVTYCVRISGYGGRPGEFQSFGLD